MDTVNIVDCRSHFNVIHEQQGFFSKCLGLKFQFWHKVMLFKGFLVLHAVAHHCQ